MTSVYLAGKMGRHQEDCSCTADMAHGYMEKVHDHGCFGEYVQDNWRVEVLGTAPRMEQRVSFMGGRTFAGPWFVDHGNHGMDAEHTADRCLKWIQSTDALFAWISAADAHGTFAEIGYAKALGKSVYVAFDRASLTDADVRELWFIKRLADGSCCVREPRRAFAIFTHWHSAQRAVSTPYGSRW